MKFSLFSPVTVNWSASRPYDDDLAALRDQAIAADELGWHGFLLAGPLPLNIFLAQHTTRLRHGQMGLTLPAWNPRRLAEDIAVADHLMGGRLDLGLGHPADPADWSEFLRVAGPLQRPHPPLFSALDQGQATVERVARAGGTFVTTTTDPVHLRHLRDRYARAAVRHLGAPPGGVAVCRRVGVAPMDEQARRSVPAFGFENVPEVAPEGVGELAALSVDHLILVPGAAGPAQVLDVISFVGEHGIKSEPAADGGVRPPLVGVGRGDGAG